MQDTSEKRERLKDFYLAIKDCKKCSLGSARTNFVFGSGNANAKIIFIGEAPGKNEDLQGKPFVGQAGRLLDSLLESIGFTRSDVFIANVLKCRPPQNRDPESSEINLCKPYLFEQIEIIDPAIICTMGRYSTRLVLNTEDGINNLRGKIFKSGSRIIIPINHPAAALYTPSRLQLLKDDFVRIKKEFENILQNDKAFAGVQCESAASNPGHETTLKKSPDFPGKDLTESVETESVMPPGNAPQDKNRQLGLF